MLQPQHIKGVYKTGALCPGRPGKAWLLSTPRGPAGVEDSQEPPGKSHRPLPQGHLPLPLVAYLVTLFLSQTLRVFPGSCDRGLRRAANIMSPSSRAICFLLVVLKHKNACSTTCPQKFSQESSLSDKALLKLKLQEMENGESGCTNIGQPWMGGPLCVTDNTELDQ